MTTKYSPSKPRYPHIHVQLSGEDGNAFAIIGRVAQALRRAGVGANDVDDFRNQAMLSDYDNVLQTCMSWVDVR